VKQCPFCAEQVQDAATVCPHCSRGISKLEIFGKTAGSCGCSMILLAIILPIIAIVLVVLYILIFGGTPAP